jgi:hypothetical protein
MKVNAIYQAQKIEEVFDKLHELLGVRYGINDEITNLALMGTARSFALVCDLIDDLENGRDEQ